jgi:hypothetical protein
MRAEDNWKDQLGKRLYNFEDEPFPDTWSKINRDLGPRRFRWWLWLPVVPLLLFLFWLANDADYSENGNVAKQTATQVASQATEKRTVPNNTSGSAAGITEPGSINKEKTTKPLSSDKEINNQAEIASASPKSEEKSGTVLQFKTTDQKVKLQGKPNGISEHSTTPVLPVPVKKDKQKNLKPLSGESSISAKSLIAVSRRQKVSSVTDGKNTSEEISGNLRTGSRNAGAVKIADTRSNNNSAELKNSEVAKVTANTQPDESKSANKPAELFTPKTSHETSEKTVAEKQSVAETKKTPKEEMALAQVPVQPDKKVPADSVSKAIKQAGDTTNTSEKPGNCAFRKWAFLLYGTPQYSFQQVQANREDEIQVLKINNLDEYSSERLGYEFGFRGQYAYSEKIQLEAGFQFAQLTQYLTFTTISGPADSVVVQQNTNQLQLQVYNRQQQQQYLFKYYLGGVFAGVNYNILPHLLLKGGIGTNYVLRTESGKESMNAPVSKVNPFITAGLRYNYQLSESLILQAGPSLQYYLKPLQKHEAPLSAKPTNFGFTIGILFRGKCKGN